MKENNQKIEIGIVYSNGNKEYFTPAQSGNFYIVDMWKCKRNGEVLDINENPCPIPIMTNELKQIGKSKFKYEYPEFNPQFQKMKIAIIKKSELNSCFSALQYTDSCHECDKIFSCKVKSIYHINGLKAKEQIELNKIMEENKTRLNNLRLNVEKTLKTIN